MRRAVRAGALMTAGLAAGVVLAPGGAVAEQVREVLIVNPTTRAVPVQGTVGLDPARNTVQGTVGIDPTGNGVQVTNLPAVQTVREAASRATAPFTYADRDGRNATVGLEDGDFSTSDGFGLAAGKRLVVEHVAMHIDLPAGQVPQLVHLEVSGGPAGLAHRHVLLPTEVRPGTWVLSQELPVTAENGQTVRLVVNRHPHRAGIGSFAWSLSGHLVEP